MAASANQAREAANSVLEKTSVWGRKAQGLIGSQWRSLVQGAQGPVSAPVKSEAGKTNPQQEDGDDTGDEMSSDDFKNSYRGYSTSADELVGLSTAANKKKYAQDAFLGRYVRVVGMNADEEFVLTLQKLEVTVNIHLNTAFIKLQGVWKHDSPYTNSPVNKSSSGSSFVLELPKLHTTTITDATAKLQSGKKFEVHVIDQTSVLAGHRQNEGQGMAQAMQLYRKKSGFNPAEYHPEMFSLPFHGMKPGETVKVSVEYIQVLTFEQGMYKFVLPLDIPNEHIATNLEDALKIDVMLDLPNYLLDETSMNPTKELWQSRGLNLRRDAVSAVIPAYQTEYENEENNNIAPSLADVCSCLHLVLESRPVEGGDFVFLYPAWADTIQAEVVYDSTPSFVVESKTPRKVPGGVITTFLAPPRPSQTASGTHPRDVVFILDRSGSMGFSKVFQHAKDALIVALQQLRSEDRFAICCFDDRQIWFGGCYPEPSDSDVGLLMTALGLDGTTLGLSSPLATPNVAFVDALAPNTDALKMGDCAPTVQEFPQGSKPICVRAKPEYIERAISWVNSIEPGGLTDILTPLKQAFWGLLSDNLPRSMDPSFLANDALTDSSCTSLAVKDPLRLRSIFIVTDGAVENEREICKFAGCIAPQVRIFTFGIGVDCNAYFLRKLASIGRGFADVCMLRSRLHAQMITAFSHAQLAVLKDIQVTLEPEDILNEDEARAVLVAFRRLENMTWCPQRVPDLYCHAPIIVSLRYEGAFPAGMQIKISGTLASGEQWSATRALAESRKMPLRKIFAQQFVDQLVADAWLADVKTPDGERLKKECVRMAVAEGIACPFTTMIAVESQGNDLKKDDALSVTDRAISRQSFELRKNNKYLVLGGSLAGVVAFGAVFTAAVALHNASEAAVASGDVDVECCDCCDCCDCADCVDLFMCG